MEDIKLVQAVCMQCGASNQVYIVAPDRQDRIEARFERHVAAWCSNPICDVPSLEDVYKNCERIEEFLESKGKGDK